MSWICPRRNKKPKIEEPENEYPEEEDQNIEEVDLSGVEKFSQEDLEKFLFRD